MILLLLIPLACCFLTCRVIFTLLPQDGIYTRARMALVYGSLAIGIFIVITTELLSYFHGINFSCLIAAWTALLAGLSMVSLRMPAFFPGVKKLSKEVFVFCKRNPVALLIPLILIVSFILAVIYPPNNYDSLTYHMARVEHWIQNKSVGHYATHVIRQLIYPPFTEWLIMHLQVLTGTDRFANTVQTLFFGGCILEVSLIIKVLGGKSSHQLLGALFTALLPMGIIQSNTTQNDIVVAYFSLAFVYCVLTGRKNSNWQQLLFAGIALGLALLTKGTAYLFCLFFCGWYTLELLKIRKQGVGNLLRTAFRFTLVPLIALSINAGHFYRNICLTGSVLGNSSKGLANEGVNIKAVGFVGLKNLLNHMPVSKNTKNRVIDMGRKWGVDVNDPGYSTNTIDWMMEGFSFHEDYAQNFWHTLLVGFSIILLLSHKKMYRHPLDSMSLYVFTLVGIAGLFCFLFKWQPWSNRLETTLFMYSCVLLGMTIANFPRWGQIISILPAAFFALMALAYSTRHPLLPVSQSIFRNSYDSFIYPGEFSICNKYIDTCTSTSFGLYIGADSPDYPYYKMLAESQKGRRIMKHMFVDNESKKYETKYLPQVIVSMEAHRDNYIIGDIIYKRTRVFGIDLALFEPDKH